MRVLFFVLVSLFLFAGCGGGSSSANDVVAVDCGGDNLSVALINNCFLDFHNKDLKNVAHDLASVYKYYNMSEDEMNSYIGSLGNEFTESGIYYEAADVTPYDMVYFATSVPYLFVIENYGGENDISDFSFEDKFHNIEKDPIKIEFLMSYSNGVNSAVIKKYKSALIGENFDCIDDSSGNLDCEKTEGDRKFLVSWNNNFLQLSYSIEKI